MGNKRPGIARLEAQRMGLEIEPTKGGFKNVSGRRSRKRSEVDGGGKNKKVVALRKSGPLAPGRKGKVSITFGLEGNDLVFRDPSGRIERRKLSDDE